MSRFYILILKFLGTKQGGIYHDYDKRTDSAEGFYYYW